MSDEKRTVIFIEVRRDELPGLGFLSRVRGFNDIDSYTNDLTDNRNFITYAAFYDRHFGFWDKIEIRKAIEKNGGYVTKITTLGKGPILSKETSDMLIDCSLMGGVAFTSGSASVIGLSGNLTQGFLVGFITAVSTFLFELVIERKRGQH